MSQKKHKKSNKAELHYDALETQQRGKRVGFVSVSEDRVLRRDDRAELSATVRESERNFTLAGFAIRKHIQYMSEFRFSVDTEDEKFNTLIEKIFNDWAMDPDRCHAARRHAFPKLLTLIERHRLVDGDVGILRCKNGAIQIIESDRIRSEWDDSADPHVIQGVHVDDVGGNLFYEIWRRPDATTTWTKERDVPAKFLDLVGYFDRHDQVRGVSPLAPAIKSLYQLNDGIAYALAKMKLEQLIGFVTKRMPEADPLGTVSLDKQAQKWTEEFGNQMKHLDLNIDEDASFLKGETPSQNFQTFTEFVIRLCLAALDVPYSFLDGSKTNFYGSKGELNGYVNGCRKRQEEMIVFLNRLTRWLLEIWWLEGRFTLPAGMELDALPFSWFGAGVPFWRLIDDSKGYNIAVANGFTNPETVCNEHGGNFYENIDRTAAAIKYARDKGVTLPYDPNVMGKQNIGL